MNRRSECIIFPKTRKGEGVLADKHTLLKDKLKDVKMLEILKKYRRNSR